MHALGFNCVKYWVQWRWSHRRNDRFVFDDLDRLMDLAYVEKLAVHLNVIFDVSPHWLYERHTDAKQITAAGRPIEPRVVAHRQIGGAPGPCYSHPGALREREKFLLATVEHFRDHPALGMWDVWNEPELSFPVRKPETYQDGSNLVCYCPNCRDRFHAWLVRKYKTLEHLNAVWGRCYERWHEVEMPTTGDGIVDFVDWREFQQDTLTAEAEWRLRLVKSEDKRHTSYLHVVPNTMRIFNSLTGPDDQAIVARSTVYACSGNAEPVQLIQSLSAAGDKVMYNVESHINGGMLNMHQRINHLPQLLRDWLPQIGLGFRGFMFWQYRSEVLGREAPAWGLVRPDGTPRPVTEATRLWIEKMTRYFPTLLACRAPSATIGIWRSRKNEFFHYAQHLSLTQLSESIESYVNRLYRANYTMKFVQLSELELGDLKGLKLMILPSCYYLTQAELTNLDRWVRSGGTVLVEAHLGGYDGTLGRHGRVMPGGGLSELWGIREDETTSAYHLETGANGDAIADSVSDDVKRALTATGTDGCRYFPIALREGHVAWGAERFALVNGTDLTVEGTFDGKTCFVSKPMGAGFLYYCGTNLGEGGLKHADGLDRILQGILRRAGVESTLDIQWTDSGVRVDVLRNEDGLKFMTIVNLDKNPKTINLRGDGKWVGLFTDRRLHLGSATTPVVLESGFSDFFVRELS